MNHPNPYNPDNQVRSRLRRHPKYQNYWADFVTHSIYHYVGPVLVKLKTRGAAPNEVIYLTDYIDGYPKSENTTVHTKYPVKKFLKDCGALL